MEQLSVQVNWLIEIKLKGDLGMKRIDCKCSEGRGSACPITRGTILEPSAKVIAGNDLVLQSILMNKD